MQVTDLRTSERFVAEPPIRGRFGRMDVQISNLANEGIQIEHKDPLLPATQSTLTFRLPNSKAQIDVQAAVIWTQMANRQGQYIYRSGLRIDSGTGALAPALSSLLDAGVARPDRESLDRKKRALSDKARQVSSNMFVRRAAKPQLSEEAIAVIREARDHLVSIPSEADRWARLGRRSFESDPANHGEKSSIHNDLVVAVWEYLDHGVDIRSIARIVG